MKYSLSFIKESNNTLVQFNSNQLHTLFLEYFNNFLTIDCFAEYYNFNRYEASKILDIGRMIDEDIYQQTGE